MIADEQPAIANILNAAGVSHGKGMQSYLTMMAVRLLEMHRVLKPTGSIYLHCDPYASHYLKMLMDAVFGVRHFRNEIIWCYRGGGDHRARTLADAMMSSCDIQRGISMCLIGMRFVSPTKRKG